MLERLKDQLKDLLGNLWDKVQESPAYAQLLEKYQDMSANAQRLLGIAVASILSLLLLSMPFTYYTSSSTSLAEFEEKKALIREMYKAMRTAEMVRQAPQPTAAAQLRDMAQSRLTSAKLVPEQIKSVETFDNKTESTPSSSIPKEVLQEGIKVSLLKLNLRQVADLAFQLQSMDASAKMVGVDVTANREDNHYYDVVFKLVSFNVPVRSAPAAPTKGTKPGRGS